MSDPVLTTFMSVAASIMVCGIGALFIRKKTQAETEGIVVEQFNKLVNTQNQLIEKNERKLKNWNYQTMIVNTVTKSQSWRFTS
jgi:hypothetical protein